MKLNLLLTCVILLAASCSSIQNSTVSREVAATTSASGDIRDYQLVHEKLTSLLGTTFTETGVVTGTPTTCNPTGGKAPGRYANQEVLDKIDYLQARAFARCGNDCKGQVYTQIIGTLACQVTVKLQAPRLNEFQEKIKNLMAEQPANYYVFAAYASKTPIGACNSKGLLLSVVGPSTFQDVLDTVTYVKDDLQKKCGESCNVAIDFSARNEIECIVSGIATPQ